jgi:uncharacterized membrane protein YkoI
LVFEHVLLIQGERFLGMADNVYDIFLSYRRDGGETMALLMHDRLVARGYRVFLDIEGLNAGSFNTKLLQVIDDCTDLVVVLSKGSLDRCVNDGDWVRTEIAYALKQGKNVVPVILRGFDWPEALPDDIAELPYKAGLTASNTEYFDAALDRLTNKFLLCKPMIKKAKPARALLKWAIPVAVAVLAVCTILLVNYFRSTASILPSRLSFNGELSAGRAAEIILAQVGGVIDFLGIDNNNGIPLYTIRGRHHFREYEIMVNSSTGAVTKFKEKETKTLTEPFSTRVSFGEAMEIALARVGGGEVQEVDFELYDRPIYDVYIRYDGQIYEVEVDVVTGETYEIKLIVR